MNIMYRHTRETLIQPFWTHRAPSRTHHTLNSGETLRWRTKERGVKKRRQHIGWRTWDDEIHYLRSETISWWGHCAWPSLNGLHLYSTFIQQPSGCVCMCTKTDIHVCMYRPFDKYTYCKSLWTKASGKCPQCKCKCTGCEYAATGRHDSPMAPRSLAPRGPPWAPSAPERKREVLINNGTEHKNPSVHRPVELPS